MQIRKAFFVLAVWSLAGCATIQQTPSTFPPVGNPGTDEGQRVIEPVLPPLAFMEAVEQDTRTLTGLPGEDYWQQDADYTLAARVFPEQRRLEGTARIVYRNNSPDTLRTLHLELAQNVHRAGAQRSEEMATNDGVQLQRVVVNGRVLQANAGYEVDQTDLAITPPQPVIPGATSEIEIDWSFEIEQQGAGGRMGYSGDDLVYLAYWYPVMQVYDDVEGWHTDPFLGRAEFYHGFADYDVSIEVPANWIIMGTGTLEDPQQTLAPGVLERMRQAYVSSEPLYVVRPADYAGNVTQAGTNGRVTWRFEADRVRDFAFSVMRNYNWMAARTPVGDRDGDGDTDYTHINAFYRDIAPRWVDVARFSQHAITFLSVYTGFPYPWPHMTAVEGTDIIGGGMEYPMMTLMGNYNAAGTEALYNVTAHELAHMWIPMIVSTNERRYSWIDEGTTTFNENQARADFYPGRRHDLEDQQQYIVAARRNLEGELMTPSDELGSPAVFVVASYYKPSVLLNALRGVIGEETFNEALQSFIQSWAYKHAYPQDFFNTFERVSGRDLDWFWRSWYYETWELDQAVETVRTANGATEIVVENRGEAVMPANLAITLQSGEVLERQVAAEEWLQGTDQAIVTVQSASPITRVEIDPGIIFPDVNRDNNVWRR